MHFPINIQFGTFVVNSHLIFELLSYALGFQYYLCLRKKTVDWMSYDQRFLIIIAAAAGALIGSRLVGYFSLHHGGDQSWAMVLIEWLGNKSILGGLIGGMWSVEIVKTIMKIKRSTGDAFVYPLILGMMIGRVGCFTQGIFDGTHGIPSNLPWAMDLGDGIARHPTQLYEIIFLGFLWWLIKRIEHRLADGARFKIFLISYILYRFLVEWIKPVNFNYWGLSAVQVACVLGFIYYLPFIFNLKSALKEKYAKS